MILEVILYALAALVLYNLVSYLRHILSLNKYPPGPFPIPIIGNLHLFDRTKPFQSVADLQKIYGDVFSISFGMERVVIVNTIEAAKESLVQKECDFIGRPTGKFVFDLISKNCSAFVFTDYGSEWHGRRTLASKALKMFGEQNSSLEEKITMEGKKLSERLEKYGSIPINLESEFRLALGSFISNIVIGETFHNMDDEGYQSTFSEIEKNAEAVQNDLTPIFPWLKYIPMYPPVRILRQFVDKLYSYLGQKYNELEKEDNANPTNYMSWMIKVSKDKDTLRKHGLKELTRDNIETLSSDILLASTDATNAILAWGILYFLYYPNYVDDALEEIQHHIGIGIYPRLQDRSSLPKCMAIIQEILRFAIGSFGLPHKATKDSSIAGMSIGKGTQLIFNIWAMHRDERHWEDPLVFKPYRWLDEDGKFNMHKHESFFPFSTGKRSCVGEQIARSELFLIFTRMIVGFRMEKGPNKKLPKLTEGTSAIAYYPKPFNVVLTKRQ